MADRAGVSPSTPAPLALLRCASPRLASRVRVARRHSLAGTGPDGSKKSARVKSAVSFISDYENELVKVAKARKCHGIICGHIHQPAIKNINGIEYLNSGDWVENLTALEYHNQQWTLFKYDAKDFEQEEADAEDELATLDNSQIFSKMLDGFTETATGTELKFKR